MQGIYKITNTINGKVYIGQSKDITKRFKTHKHDSTRVDNKRGQTPMYEEMRLYGVDNFVIEVIESCIEESLNDRERYWLKHYMESDEYECYNLTSEPKGFNDKAIIEKTHTPEIMKKHGERIREYNLKSWSDPEYRAKKSKQSSEIQKERMKDPEYKAKKVADLAKYVESVKKVVHQYDKEGNFIAEFEGVREAGRATGIGSSLISAVAKGGKYRKSAGGYVWKYPQENV